ncbi:Rieske (2Fe-2S) protein [Kaarinaea lacus]
MSWILLTDTASISAGNAQEFVVDTAFGPLELFVVNDNQQFYAYENRCPHTGVNLNWQPDQFFDIDNKFLQCSTHGALFRTTDGYCVRGPCAGSRLESIPLKVENGSIYIASN